ncbi:MAG: sigma-E processing peptidase SpoIIGA, partial [Oscillospiraceae bacterium]|nr:sigma-E processing peptidase SpoIIGA [Oscillospiraceae bacterium]
MRVVYIDTLFAMNLIINYFLLLATAKICAVAAKRARLWLAASA